MIDHNLVQEHNNRFARHEERIGKLEEGQSQIMAFIIDHQATERAHKEYQRKNLNRQNLIVLLLTLLCTILLVIISWKGLPKTSEMFRSEIPEVAFTR